MTGAIDRTFDSLQVGETASFERTVSESDFDAFAELSGDYNPLHMDERYATETPFGSRILHGMFLGSMVSRLVGMHLPGKRALLLKESLEFKKPVRAGDVITVSGTLVSKSEATRIIGIDVYISTRTGIIAQGSALVSVLE